MNRQETHHNQDQEDEKVLADGPSKKNLKKIISDVASGGLSTRDGIQELKNDILNGGVDVVLIWNVSRAFRSMIHFTRFYEFLNNHNVELISVSCET